MNAQQLPLGLRWPSHQRLETYLAGDNIAALEGVRASVLGQSTDWLYLQGAAGAGKTHLLVGACRAVLDAGGTARYLPLAALPLPRVDAIASFTAERGELLAIDDVPAIAGDGDAERALFALYNRARESHATLLFAAVNAPARIGIKLPDLVSRLSACTQFVLQPLNERGRREVLCARAQQRGLEIDDNVLDWLFARQPRNLAALMELFERLDHAALAAQRRITIPFLREMLGAQGSHSAGGATD